MEKTPLVITVMLFILMGGLVSAHHPIFVEKDNTDPQASLPISEPHISWAVYGELAPGKVNYYEFEVPAQGLAFFSQLMVPTRPQYKEFRPDLALIGPGLPQVANSVPFEIPSGSGAVILAWQDKEIFFEPFTQTRYYMAKELRRPLAEGTWRLAVYHPEGKGGKYTLAVGEQEKWGRRDIIAFQSMWFRTRWWYSPGQTIAMILGGLGLVTLVVWQVVKVVLRRV